MLLIITLFNVMHAHGQGDRHYNPKEISIIDIKQIDKSVHQSFTQAEICMLKKENLVIGLHVNMLGAVDSIFYLSFKNISNRKVLTLKCNLQKNAKFFVPEEVRSIRMSKFRVAYVGIKFGNYCK